MFYGKNLKECNELYKKLSLRLCSHHEGDSELMELLTDAFNIRKKELDQEAESAFTAFSSEKWLDELQIFQEDGVYREVKYNINLDDDRIEIIQTIKKFSKKEGKPNLEYVESVETYGKDKGYITCAQFNCLLKTYSAFKMDKNKK